MKVSSSLSPVVIAGMHRSGTSVVASMVSSLGVSLGDRLLGASFANPTGHFEDLDFLELHENILRASRGAWDAPPARDRLRKTCRRYDSELDRLLGNRMAAGRAWGWKEPRTSLLLPLYAAKLPRMRLIRCRRDPQAICSSLARRNGFSAGYAEKLTAYYEKEIDTFVQAHPEMPVLTVEYDRLVREPDSVGREIAHFLGINADSRVLAQFQSLVLSRRETRKRADETRREHRFRLVSRAIANPAKASRVVLDSVRRHILRLEWARRH